LLPSLRFVSTHVIDVGHDLILLFTLAPCLGFELGLLVLVELELSDNERQCGNPHQNRGSVDLFPGDALDVDNPLLSIDGRELSLARLVHSPRDENLVVLADGHGPDAVLGLELLGEVGVHELLAGLAVGYQSEPCGTCGGCWIHVFVNADNGEGERI